MSNGTVMISISLFTCISFIAPNNFGVITSMEVTLDSSCKNKLKKKIQTGLEFMQLLISVPNSLIY